MPEVEDEFGGYRIDGVLGRGGMGVVFLAWSRHLGRRVALKVLAPEVAEEPGARERFLREAAALARVDSPHVIQILGSGEVDGRLHLVMQYVVGRDLSVELRDGPLAPRRALDVVAQVASALGAAHAVGVVHRDVKPGNVLLRTPLEHEDADFVYLCDFGIARTDVDDPATAAGGVVGTIGFLAPERLRGAPATAASDVYALGCLLWTVLTGEQPYRGSPAEVMQAHLEHPVPQLVVDGPRTAALNELIAAVMAKDPAARPPVREIRDRIRALSDGRYASGAPDAGPSRAARGAAPDPDGTVPIGAGARGDDRHGPGSDPARPRSRRSVLLAGAGALLVVAAVAAGVTLTGGPAPAERIAAATPTGVTGCRAVDPGPDDVDARVVCPAGPGLGELRISALGSASAAQDFLDVAAGREVAVLRDGRCPADLPARERWERGSHSGTLVCVTAGAGTRYAWSDASTATVSVLDGAPGQSYPADLAAVQAFHTDLRFGSG